MNAFPRTIVIVGAGFAGTAVAINLLRLKHEQPVADHPY
jgi:2-polyprenyl-6-methoxyphenol hydroxylase-like FAD-dependent oxidoreductase